MIIDKFISYLTFRKQESGEKSQYLRMMHGINKISILMFLVGIAVMIWRFSK
ncbi:MAG: DUF6728 family protein [Bacteroidia bacterium]|jgi:hypothetical protein